MMSICVVALLVVSVQTTAAIKGLPVVTILPANNRVIKGGNLTFECHVTGSPRPQARWRTELLQSLFFIEEKISGSTLKLNMHLINVSSSDNLHNLTCEAENEAGRDSDTVPLDIQFPARILFLKDPVAMHHWCFPFAVDGNPEPNITWLYNGKVLRENVLIYTEIISDVNNVKHGCLYLSKPTHINNGEYTLLVHNSLGSDRASADGRFMDNPFDLFNPEAIIPEPVDMKTKAEIFNSPVQTAEWVERPNNDITDIASSYFTTQGGLRVTTTDGKKYLIMTMVTPADNMSDSWRVKKTGDFGGHPTVGQLTNAVGSQYRPLGRNCHNAWRKMWDLGTRKRARAESNQRRQGRHERRQEKKERRQERGRRGDRRGGGAK